MTAYDRVDNPLGGLMNISAIRLLADQA